MFLILFLTSLVLLGCRNGENHTEKDPVQNDLIASEKLFPVNFHEMAFERKEPPYFRYLVRKVENESEFYNNWKLYGFENKYPDIDFNKHDVFFIGVEESGSCPFSIANIEISHDHNTITIPLSKAEGVCTDDATPRTFVLKIDKERTKEIETVVIVQSEVESSIPIID